MSITNDHSLTIDANSDEEDAEEQRRREAELADLLTAGINAFDDDGSTMNSTLTSFEETQHQGIAKAKNPLKDADAQEQLKILYDVRVREVEHLRNELNKVQEERTNEVRLLKNKLTLSEAEFRHLQVTLSNNESLLVEKSENIRSLKDGLVARDGEIEKLKKIVEDQNLEICTYQSTLNELQLKLSDNNPFNGSHKINSEALHKVNQDKILKLETLLQEEAKKVQILEKEKRNVEEDMKKILETKKVDEQDNNMTIMALSKKLQSAQQQCKDLFLLGEAIKKESDHFKERLQQIESGQFHTSGDVSNIKEMDKETLSLHIEKLRRMLLDKDIELNTIKSKLKFYDSDFEELFEYRHLLSNIFSHNFKPCSNIEHEEQIIFMQRQLQSYQQAVEDRNNQIISLNSLNKELQEKIEEMLEQTRNDIQNISQKYSLPQLETMSQELKNAEDTINELRRELNDKDKLCEEINNLRKVATQKDANFEILLKEKNAEKAKNQELQQELVNENERVKTQLQKIYLKLGVSEAEIFQDGNDDVMKQYGKIHDQLQHVLSHLENVNAKRANFNLIFTLKKQIESSLKSGEFGGKLEDWDNILSDFIESLKNSGSSEVVNAKLLLEEEKSALYKENLRIKEDLEGLRTTVQTLNEDLDNLRKCLRLAEVNKSELEKQLSDAKLETELHRQINECNIDMLEQNLTKELKNVEEANNDISGNDVFQKCLQAHVLKAEISLRGRLQEENLSNFQRIEEQYKKVITEKTNLYNKEKEKWKRQEANFRTQFADVLEECGKKMTTLEAENVELNRKLRKVVSEYEVFKKNAMMTFARESASLEELKKNMEDLNGNWGSLLEYYMEGATVVAKKQVKVAQKVSRMISACEKELDLVENAYNEKIRKFKAEWERNKS